MRKVILCDIPIYPISEEEYRKKLDKKRKEIYDYFIKRHNEEEFSKKYSCKEMLPFVNWKYNTMVGYIEITVQKNDIVFELYMSDIKRYRYYGNKKHYMNYIQTIGLHFWTEDKTNIEIKKELYLYINMIRNEFLYKKGVYLDMIALDNVTKYIDLKQFIEDANAM